MRKGKTIKTETENIYTKQGGETSSAWVEISVQSYATLLLFKAMTALSKANDASVVPPLLGLQPREAS